jgi:hypothetical protein
LFDEKLFPKCKTSEPKLITQVKKPVLIDTSKPRTVSWNDNDDFYQIARRPPFHFIPPSALGAGPPAPPAPPALSPPSVMPLGHHRH